jgi:aminotransferase
MDRTDLEQIAALADEHGFTVISDEVYDEMVFDDAVFTSIAEVKPSTAEAGAEFDRFLAIGSFSKTYAMTGWRCGFVIGSQDFIAPMALLQEGLTSSLPGFVQEAAVAAIEGPQTAVEEMVASYARQA